MILRKLLQANEMPVKKIVHIQQPLHTVVMQKEAPSPTTAFIPQPLLLTDARCSLQDSSDGVQITRKHMTAPSKLKVNVAWWSFLLSTVIKAKCGKHCLLRLHSWYYHQVAPKKELFIKPYTLRACPATFWGNQEKFQNLRSFTFILTGETRNLFDSL